MTASEPTALDEQDAPDPIAAYVDGLGYTDFLRLVALVSKRRDDERWTATRNHARGIATHRIDIDRILTDRADEPAVARAARAMNDYLASSPSARERVWMSISIAESRVEDQMESRPGDARLTDMFNGLNLFRAMLRLHDHGVRAIGGVIVDGDFRSIELEHSDAVRELDRIMQPAGSVLAGAAAFAHPIAADQEQER